MKTFFSLLFTANLTFFLTKPRPKLSFRLKSLFCFLVWMWWSERLNYYLFFFVWVFFTFFKLFDFLSNFISDYWFLISDKTTWQLISPFRKRFRYCIFFRIFDDYWGWWIYFISTISFQDPTSLKKTNWILFLDLCWKSLYIPANFLHMFGIFRRRFYIICFF